MVVKAKNLNLKKINLNLVFIFCIILFFVSLSACVNPIQKPFSTFTDSGEPICKTDGKPNVFMFSTSWCSHCQWIGPAFEEVAQEYMNAGKIQAIHWELDKEDDALTAIKEEEVPAMHLIIFTHFSPDAGVPVFVFGCRYYRIGTAFEHENNLEKEKQEFRKVIDKLLEES
ncbi:MAG: thioredoxin family protein [Candidatus Diapherotrites archaeon]